MNQRLVTLSLFALAILVSGCTGGGGGQGTQDQGDQAVTVDQLQVNPSEIRAGSTVRVRMGVTNSGELPAKVNLGSSEGDVDGNQILTNHCPDIFDISDFSASSSNVSDTQNTYALQSGYSIQMNWELQQSTDNVPLNGYDCQLKFEVPFDYSVEAFRQLQVKANDDVQGTEELFAKSSQGPMKIEMETIGSSSERGAPTFLEGDNAEVLVQLENKNPEDSSYTGTVELNPPVMDARGVSFEEANISEDEDRVEVAEDIARRMEGIDASDVSGGGQAALCPRPGEVPLSGNLRIYEGGSKVFRCTLDWELEENGVAVPSLRGEVFARANYSYVKDVGTRSVKVNYRGQ